MKNGCQVRTPSSLREDGTERNAQFISALYAHFLAFSPFLQLFHTLRNFLLDLGNYSDYKRSITAARRTVFASATSTRSTGQGGPKQ